MFENYNNIYFVRHGETYNNELKIINGGNDDSELNDKGIISSKELGKNINELNFSFDLILTSPMIRCIKTLEIILNELQYVPIIVEYDFLREQSFGEFIGMKVDYICNKYSTNNPGQIYRNNSEEPLIDFYNRVINGYKNIINKYNGKNILIISHGGVYRVLNSYINKIDINKAFFEEKGIENAAFIKLR